MIMAHELSHVVLGHKLDTKLAFNDRMFFPDQESFKRLDFKRSSADEEAADTKALELLKNSPYKDKLASAGLFLRAIQPQAPDLPKISGGAGLKLDENEWLNERNSLTGASARRARALRGRTDNITRGN